MPRPDPRLTRSGNEHRQPNTARRRRRRHSYAPLRASPPADSRNGVIDPALEDTRGERYRPRYSEWFRGRVDVLLQTGRP